MPRFKVNVIQILLKNNKTAKYGELVEEEQLNSKADALVKEGYIVKPTKAELDAFAKANKTNSQAEAEAKAKAETEAKAKAEAEAKAKADSDNQK